jgi:hypothetical protein
MQTGDYECEIVDVGVDENKDGKAFCWLLIRPEGLSGQELKLWLHTDECRLISEANLRSLGWTGDWYALDEVKNQRALFHYGPDKTGQYMNWSFPFRSQKNTSVLERLAVTQAPPPNPHRAGKDPNGRPEGATAAARKSAPAASGPSGDDIPF